MGYIHPGRYYSTSPVLATQNLLIIGGYVQDDQSIDEPSGVVRAYNAANGKMVWNWDSGNPTETKPIAKNKICTRNSPKVWSVMTADEN